LEIDELDESDNLLVIEGYLVVLVVIESDTDPEILDDPELLGDPLDEADPEEDPIEVNEKDAELQSVADLVNGPRDAVVVAVDVILELVDPDRVTVPFTDVLIVVEAVELFDTEELAESVTEISPVLVGFIDILDVPETVEVLDELDDTVCVADAVTDFEDEIDLVGVAVSKAVLVPKDDSVAVGQIVIDAV
jgi:hypothetical protein